MTKAAALTLRRVLENDPAADASVRTQAAFVRSLIDEVDRRPSSDARKVALRLQLDEESERLERMSRRTASPLSGAHLRTCPAEPMTMTETRYDEAHR